MSEFRRLSRPLVALGISAVAVAGVAPAAHAATASREATCSFPLIGPQPVKVTVAADLPDVVAAGSNQPSSSATITLDWGSNSPFKTFAASANGTVAVAASPALTTPQSTDFTTAQQSLVGSFAGFTAPNAAGTKQWVFDDAGVALTARLLDASGQPKVIVDPEFAPDTDNDPQTTNVRCTWKPSTNAVIHTAQVTAAPVQPQVTRAVKCKLPLGLTVPGKLNISGFRETVRAGQTYPLALKWDVQFTDSRATTLYETVEAKTLEGTSLLPLQVTLPGQPVALTSNVRGTAAQAPIATPLKIAFEGETPGVVTQGPGGTLTVGLGANFTLKTIARDAEGAPIRLDSDEIQTDQDPATTDIPCQVDSGQNPVIHTAQVYPSMDLVMPPSNLKATAFSGAAAELTWTASPSNVKHYVVDCGKGPQITTEPRLLLTGLTPNTAYSCTVRAVDFDGNVSSAVSVQFKTFVEDLDTPFAFRSVTGAVALKSLASGTLPLTGSLDFSVAFGGTTIKTGELKLNPTSANLKALGFIPVTAKIEFANAGPLSGSLTREGKLTAQQTLRVKLPEIRAFGIVLGGGTNCQTRSASTVKLESDTAVTQAGGSAVGTFPISNLSGCGALNGLVSPLTSSTGNTIRLVLKP